MVAIQLDYYQMPVELENIVDSWLNRDTKEAKNLLKLQMHVPKFVDLEREKYCPTRQKTIFTHHGTQPAHDVVSTLKFGRNVVETSID